MFGRITSSVLVGIVISLFVFLVMQAMISPSRTADAPFDLYPSIDFVRLTHEEPPSLPKKRSLPEQPRNPSDPLDPQAPENKDQPGQPDADD